MKKLFVLSVIAATFLAVSASGQVATYPSLPVLVKLPKVINPKDGYSAGGTVNVRVTVNENGDVVGIVTSAGEKTVARPVAALDSVLSRVKADTQARWAQMPGTSPTPHATPKPRLLFAPAPSFPPGQSLPGQGGTGRFRLTFDAQGNVTDIRLVASTGNPYFDQSAIKTLRQWKSAPSQGWQATVPVTFRTR